MTQEYTPSIETIIDVYASARANAMQIQLSDEWDREHKRIVKQAMGTLAAHDAQIRADALRLTDKEARAALDMWNDIIADSDDGIVGMQKAFTEIAEFRGKQES